MKRKRILAWILSVVMTAVMTAVVTTVPAGIVFAENEESDVKTVYDFYYSAPYDSENNGTIYVGKELPADMTITGISASAIDIIRKYSPTYNNNASTIKINFTTCIQPDPTSGTFTVILNTNYGDITINIHINLTGKYNVNISAYAMDALYDGNTHKGYYDLRGVTLSGAEYTGDYIFKYEKADGTPLEGEPSALGSYKLTIAIPDDNESYKGSVSLMFNIISEAEAEYQEAAGGEWRKGAFTEALANVYDGGTVKLLKNLDLDKTVFVTRNMTLSSDDASNPKIITSTINGHGYLLRINASVVMENIIIDGGSKNNVTAIRALASVGDGTNEGELTLGSGSILRGNNNITEKGAGGGVAVLLGKLNINSGTITGNSAYYGGGIGIINGTVDMDNGSISNNTSNGNGGGIYVVNGTVDMDNGSISNNTSNGNGGGVYLSASPKAVFKLNAGEITGNSAYGGGGVYVCQTAAFEISGGSITGNRADYVGGVECVPSSNITLTGAPIIKDNSSKEEGTNGGLYDDGNDSAGYSNILIGGLADNAEINLYTWKPSEGFLIAKPIENYSITEADMSKLTYIGDGYGLRLNAAGNVELFKSDAQPSYTNTVLKRITEDMTQDNSEATAVLSEIDTKGSTIKKITWTCDGYSAEYSGEISGTVSFGIVIPELLKAETNETTDELQIAIE
ncbi:MAG: hypothetical protein Q4G33_01875 [bacterium]|nr:hypothetical protein [bacterium]